MNFVRLISVRVAPMDLNLDMALVDAFLELSTRMTELMDVSSFGVLSTERRVREVGWLVWEM